MSKKTIELYNNLLKEFAPLLDKKSSAHKKNLEKIFVYIPEKKGQGASLVVGRHDLKALPILEQILEMASVSGLPDKVYVFRDEFFLRWPLKPEWVSKVISAFQSQLKQRQDLLEEFSK